MYYRKIQDNKRFQKIASITIGGKYIGCGAYYDKKEQRYVRYFKGNGYTYLKRLSNRKVRKKNIEFKKGNHYRKVFDVWWNWI